MRKWIQSEAYERSEIVLLEKLLHGSENILELGAAIGLVGLYCKKIKHIRNLTSVEPNPATIQRLRKNYALNGLEPVIIEAAVTDRDAPIQMHVSEMFWSDSVYSNADHAEGKTISVQGLCLASICKQVGYTVDTLIIDIEGAEQHIDVAEIPASVERIVFEPHPRILGAKTAFAVLERLIRHGFSIEDQHGECWVMRRDPRREV